MPTPSKITLVSKTFEEKGATLLTSFVHKDTPLRFICSIPGCTNEHQVSWGNFKNRKSNPSLLCKHHLMLSVGKFQPTTEFLASEFEAKGARLLSEYKREDLPLRFLCSVPGCQEEHTVTWNNYRNGRNGSLRCSSHTYLGHPRGKEHPLWKETKIASRDKALFGPWSRAVMGLYEYTCAITGQRGGELSAHHLHGRAKNPELAYMVSNGVVLTRDLHKEFHDKFCGGRQYSSSLEDFQGFFMEKTGRVFVPKPSNAYIGEDALVHFCPI